MSSRDKRFSVGAKDDKSEVEEASGIIMIGHYDARLNPNYRGSNSSDNNNSTFSSEQANAGTCTRTVNNASSQVAANANSNANPPKASGRLCSHCSTPGHRHPECPHRPCKHCNVMGHVGKDCPEIVEDRAQRRQAAWRRYHAHLASGANRK